MTYHPFAKGGKFDFSDNGNKGAVYVLHLSYPNMSLEHHYVGYVTKASEVHERIKQHTKGKGALLTKKVISAGGKIKISYIFYNAPHRFEIYLQHLCDAYYWCPIVGKKLIPIPHPRDLPPNVDPIEYALKVKQQRQRDKVFPSII